MVVARTRGGEGWASADKGG